MKGKLILTFILLSTFSTQIIYANACHSRRIDYPSDEWLIDNAINEVKKEHPKHIDTVFSGIITTRWHKHPHLDAPLHKHVLLTATFGYQDSGTVRWEGRSYADGGIYTFHYSNHDPEEPIPEVPASEPQVPEEPAPEEPTSEPPAPEVQKFHTKTVYLGPAQYWDGSKYVNNIPSRIQNTGESTCYVLVSGSGGYTRTISLNAGYSLVVYPPIGIDITLSIQ